VVIRNGENGVVSNRIAVVEVRMGVYADRGRTTVRFRPGVFPFAPLLARGGRARVSHSPSGLSTRRPGFFSLENQMVVDCDIWNMGAMGCTIRNYSKG
jgi:hypothetical protein